MNRTQKGVCMYFSLFASVTCNPNRENPWCPFERIQNTLPTSDNGLPQYTGYKSLAKRIVIIKNKRKKRKKKINNCKKSE